MTSNRGGIGMIGRGGMDSRGRIRRSKIHVLSFTDHTGKEALIVFHGREMCPLPPLYSFTIYLAHEDVDPENIQTAKLLDILRRSTPLENRCSFRLEIYFLPVPGIEEIDESCIAHYRQEKRRRGDDTRQIQALETLIWTGIDSSSRRLPGFVPSYINDPISEYHHGLLYSCLAANWTTDKQIAPCVYFDSISEEKYGPLVEEAGESEVLPSVCVAFASASAA